MSTGKRAKKLCVDELRHAEYYQMQTVLDDLYERSSKGEKFTNLMEPILSRENILLAYICSYTKAGRQGLHDNLEVLNKQVAWKMMREPALGRSTEYADNRISLFFAQYGKCAVTGNPFQSPEEIHCHHRVPRHKGGTDKYSNLVLITDQVHRLLHATKEETLRFYMDLLKLSKPQLQKLNRLRDMAGLAPITAQ